MYPMGGCCYADMVVDDDPDVVFVLEWVLRRYGCEVTGITDGKKCQEMTEEQMPDVIFLDVTMPDICGWEICKKIKDDPKTSGIFISMLSTRCDERDKTKSLEDTGANRHLCKPIDFEEVKKVVEDVKSGGAHLAPPADILRPL